MKMQPGDYIHTADIPDKATHNRIREAVRAMGYDSNPEVGRWDERDISGHAVLCLWHDGDLVWVRKECPECDGRRLTPADILPTCQAHPAADLLAGIAAEARINPEPWTAYEHDGIFSGWRTPIGLLDLLDSVAKGVAVRRKPRTITINGHEVPEPCREPLEDQDIYYLPAPARLDGADISVWCGWDEDYHRLRAGLVHLTPEAAKAHSDALVSFTAQEAVKDEPTCDAERVVQEIRHDDGSLDLSDGSDVMDLQGVAHSEQEVYHWTAGARILLRVRCQDGSKFVAVKDNDEVWRLQSLEIKK